MEENDKEASEPSLEFKWLKKRGRGGKEKKVQFYESFSYDGVEYGLYDCVYMYTEGLQEPHIGKLIKIWEHLDYKTKKVKVHWFFRPEEILVWLEGIKTLENEILFASGEGVGLTNINPLEAIAGQCNVVCVSKDCRNPQPSDVDLKAADFIFYRTFDVQSCTISDKMEENVGGVEIKYVFNRKEGESISPLPSSICHMNEEKQNTTTTCGEPPLLTKNLPSKPKGDREDNTLVKVDFEGEEMPPPKDKADKVEAKERDKTLIGSDKIHDQSLMKRKTDAKKLPEEKQVEVVRDAERLKDMPTNKKLKGDREDNTLVKVDFEGEDMPPHKDKADNVEAKERNKSLIGSDKIHDRSLMKSKTGDKKLPKEKLVQSEVVRDAERLKDMPSNKSKVDSSIKLHDRSLMKSKTDDKKLPKEKLVESEVVRDAERLMDMPSNKSKVDSSIKLHDRFLMKSMTDDKKLPKEKLVESEVVQDGERLKDMPSNKSKVDSSNHKNGKVLGSEKRKISAELTDDLEGRALKKTKAEGSFKKPDIKKHGSVQKQNINNYGSNGKDLVPVSVLKSGQALESLGINKEPRGEQSDESKRKLSMSRSPKVPSSLSSAEDKKTPYQEFTVTPKPNADRSGWFRRLPWDERLKNAYDQGTAILLHNLDPDYTSGEVEDIIWHAFTENCEAKILQRTALSGPHYCHALILLKTREASQKILSKLDEECLMLSNGRPLVGTTCPPLSSRKSSKFFGHLAIDKCRIQNQRDMDEAVSTSHFSQPNTIEYDMAMEWCLLQSRSEKWWEMMHKQQGNELKKLQTILVRKSA